jgi:hypothetical protein
MPYSRGRTGEQVQFLPNQIGSGWIVSSRARCQRRRANLPQSLLDWKMIFNGWPPQANEGAAGSDLYSCEQSPTVRRFQQSRRDCSQVFIP